MRFLLGLVLGILIGGWVVSNNYTWRLPIEHTVPPRHDHFAPRDGGEDPPIPAFPQARGLLEYQHRKG